MTSPVDELEANIRGGDRQGSRSSYQARSPQLPLTEAVCSARGEQCTEPTYIQHTKLSMLYVSRLGALLAPILGLAPR